MKPVEVVTVAVVVVSALALLWRRLVPRPGGVKGTCKGCGDSCACESLGNKDTRPSGKQKE